MNKKQLSERDICTKFITPALEQAGWDVTTQVKEEYPLTKVRVRVENSRHTREPGSQKKMIQQTVKQISQQTLLRALVPSCTARTDTA